MTSLSYPSLEVVRYSNLDPIRSSFLKPKSRHRMVIIILPESLLTVILSYSKPNFTMEESLTCLNEPSGRSQGDGMEMKVEIGQQDVKLKGNELEVKCKVPTSTSRKLKKDESSAVVRKKEPKFVPFEPYKAAVKPILQTSTSHPGHATLLPVPSDDITNNTSNINNINKLPQDGPSFSNREELHCVHMDQQGNKQIRDEKNALEAQLKIQIQVNKELKKLLVASVGEDLQARVQFLTEDKARLAHDIVKYSQKLLQESEQLEKLSIQCDVWRSKFLASSVMVYELANWKACLCHELQEAKVALKMLLNEQCHITTNSMLNTYRHLKSLRDAFDPLTAQRQVPQDPSAMDSTELAQKVEKLAEALHFRLLSCEPNCNSGNTGMRLTRGQLFAQQVIESPHLYHTLSEETSGNPNLAGNAMSTRFHPSVRYEQLTFYCCNHCKGEIKIV